MCSAPLHVQAFMSFAFTCALVFLANMPVVSEVRHPNSMDFDNGRLVILYRSVFKMKWKDIRKKVICLNKKRPSLTQMRDHFRKFNTGKGQVEFQYGNCGRKPWKVTKEVETFIVRRLLALRAKIICTSTTLQSELATEKGISLSTSAIRKILNDRGYQWRPRCTKPKYSKDERTARWDFALEVLEYTPQELKKALTMSMDGVVLTLPPTDETDRENYCKIGDTHIYRKANEMSKPELCGGDKYDKQVPYARQCPMWGGIGAAGFGLVMFHHFRKVDTVEWVDSVESGELKAACREASGKTNGPWMILCDNETFLTTAASKAAHAKMRVELWHVPPRSPDLNPVELFWAKVRLWLRQMDLKDLRARRAPVHKTALKERVRRLLRTDKARRAAKNIFGLLHKKARLVCKAKGGAIRG